MTFWGAVSGQTYLEGENRRGRRTLDLDAVWAHQLNVAATEVVETQDPAEESVVLFYQNYSSAAQMERSIEDVRASVKGVVFKPDEALRKKWRAASMVTSSVPDGVSALKKAGVDAVKDVEVVPLTRAEALVGCHTIINRGENSHNFGYCHSPPTSSKIWATRTKTADGRMIPLLWTCHVYAESDIMAGHTHAPCHVNDRMVVALTPAHAGLLSP